MCWMPDAERGFGVTEEGEVGGREGGRLRVRAGGWEGDLVEEEEEEEEGREEEEEGREEVEEVREGVEG